jgi:hypothetical protein
MINEINEWVREFSDIEKDIAIYKLGWDEEYGIIYLPLHKSFYEELKQKYTLKDLDIESLKKRYILIKQNDSFIYCNRIVSCEKCEHLEKCCYCVTKKLMAQ